MCSKGSPVLVSKKEHKRLGEPRELSFGKVETGSVLSLTLSADTV